MKRSFSNLLLLFIAGVIAAGFSAMPVFGQEAEKEQQLQRTVESQQKQLEAQQKQLDEQRQLLQELQKQVNSEAADTDKEKVPAAAEKPPAAHPPNAGKAKSPEKSEIAEANKYDRENPTGSNVTYFDPTRVINIPGTDTSIGLHGLVEFQIIHDTNGLNNNRFDTATILVNGAPSQTKFNVNPTQIALSSTTPVQKGRLNTMISMDFNGQLDRPEPRLRIAYGEFVSGDWGLGILGGQAYVTMFDLRAVPETLDFAGPAGLWQQRQPLLRFTKAFAGQMLAEASIETPENVTYVDAVKRTRLPDAAIAWTWNAGGRYISHLRLAGLLRDLGAEGAAGATDSALGWSATGSGKISLPFLGAKDNFKFTLHYGDGYGTQIKGGPAEGAFNTATSTLETIPIFGTYGGIQHFWSDKFRSNLVYGYVDSDPPAFLSGDTFDNTSYAAVDLIWNPYKSLDVGVEYLYGRRENKDGAAGTSNRFIFSTRFVF